MFDDLNDLFYNILFNNILQGLLIHSKELKVFGRYSGR